jgi:predicted aspartyl protease
MPDYDSILFNPPAPLALVTLINPQNNFQISNVPMLLDTGADAALIPQTCAQPLNLKPENQIWEIEAFDGSTNQSVVVNLQMIFQGRSFRGEYLLIEQDYGIIGRNILNLLNINFDGRNLRWEIL